MGKYRKRPVVIEAEQFHGLNGSNSPPAKAMFMEWPIQVDSRGPYLVIETLEGAHRADLKDWIIKGVKGEYYPCKPDVFELTYEQV